MHNNLPHTASIFALRGIWHDLTTGMEKAQNSETTVIAVRNITWRSREDSLQDWMPALVSLVVSKAAGKVARALLQKQLALRQLWMQHGGPIFTADGNRRKRKYIGDDPDGTDELREDIERLQSLYKKVLNGRENDVVTAMVALSGSVITGDDLGVEMSRKAARGALGYMFGRLPAFTKVPGVKIGGVYAPPFGRKLR